jgi:hypothetical protein
VSHPWITLVSGRSTVSLCDVSDGKKALHLRNVQRAPQQIQGLEQMDWPNIVSSRIQDYGVRKTAYGLACSKDHRYF